LTWEEQAVREAPKRNQAPKTKTSETWRFVSKGLIERWILRKVLASAICLLVSFFSSCQPTRISLGPLPSQIKSIEGHASLRISGSQGSSRSKFAFVFQLPERARIEVSGVLGRVLYRIVIVDGESYLIVPSKKVYWQGQEEQIIEKFLGFQLNLSEMINLLTGKWKREQMEIEAALKGWSLQKDQEGRIISGQRGDLSFQIVEFIDKTPFAHRLIFEHPLSSGHLKILKIGLNKPVNEKIFSRQFLEKYSPRTWEGIQELIGNAR
jgi:hypothetical protein